MWLTFVRMVHYGTVAVEHTMPCMTTHMNNEFFHLLLSILESADYPMNLSMVLTAVAATAAVAVGALGGAGLYDCDVAVFGVFSQSMVNYVECVLLAILSRLSVFLVDSLHLFDWLVDINPAL